MLVVEMSSFIITLIRSTDNSLNIWGFKLCVVTEIQIQIPNYFIAKLSYLPMFDDKVEPLENLNIMPS